MAHKIEESIFRLKNKLESLKIEDISVNHEYKISGFKDIPEDRQVLIL